MQLQGSARRLIDTHVHFYDRTRSGPDLTWQWLGADFRHPVLGDIDGIKGQRYGPTELHAESRLAAIEGVIHVQAARGSADPVLETLWLDELARTSRVPILGVVAEVRLSRLDARATLAKHTVSPLVRGVRDFELAEHGIGSRSDAGYAALSQYDLTFDWHAPWTNANSAIGLAQRHPDIRLVIEHCAAPPLRDTAMMRSWRSALRRLSAYPNVAIKLSGWGMSDPNWTPASVRSALLDCLDAFGSERALFGSNWPFGRLSSSYTDVVETLTELCESLTIEEQANIHHRSAARWYRLPAVKGQTQADVAPS